MFQEIPQQQPSVNQPAPQPAPSQTPPPPVKPALIPVQTTQEERIWSVIGYVAFLGILTLAMMPKSAFCKRHAAHGLTIFILWFVLLIAVLFLLWPLPSVLVGMVESLLFLGAGALVVLGIIRSIQSFEMNVPILTPIAMKLPVDAIIGTVTGKTPEKTEEPKAPEPPQTPQQ